MPETIFEFEIGTTVVPKFVPIDPHRTRSTSNTKGLIENISPLTISDRVASGDGYILKFKEKPCYKYESAYFEQT